MPSASGNILTDIEMASAGEQLTELLRTPTIRIERIVSRGYASPASFWYDQDWAEWVVVLQGAGCVVFEGDDTPVMLGAGDYLYIPPHRRHRVQSTDPEKTTVWLAIHHG